MDERKTLNKPRRLTRGAIMALVLVAALTVGAAAFAAHQRSLRELVLQPGTETETAVPEAAQPEGAPGYDSLREGEDFISLQGYAGSPEKQAMEEWTRFRDGYDADGALLAQIGNGPTGLDARYDAYLVYTQEMADALDAIAAKYGLALHTGFTDSSTEELKDLYGDFLGANHGWCYRYDDGTFQFDGENVIEGYGQLDYQFRRTAKGVFDEVGLNVTDIDEYEQWSYETACGETVLLALGPGKALIFADLPESFVAVNVLAGALLPDGSNYFPDSPPLTAENLETLANSFDFSLLG